MPSPSSAHWLSLVASIWLQTINGPNSDFPVYSSDFKGFKNLSQVQLNFLAFASDAGKLFGWFSGVAALYVPLWLVAVVGATFGLVGYGVQFLFLDKLSYWHLFLFTSLAGNGICWINTVCYLLCIRNFPSDSRVAVSLATSYLGLSAKVYTTMADTIPHSVVSKAKAYLLPRADSKAKTYDTYLLLNAVMPMLVTLVVAPALRVFDMWSEARTDAAFLVMFAVTLATGACAVVGSIGSTSNGLSSTGHMVSLRVLLVTPILVPIVLKIRESMNKIRETKRENKIHDLGTDEVDAAVAVLEVEVETKEEGVMGKGQEEVGALRSLRKLDFWHDFFSYMWEIMNKIRETKRENGVHDHGTDEVEAEVEVETKEEGVMGKGQEEVGGLRLLRKLDFWLYFFSYMFSATLGLVFLNNLGQIAESRSFGNTATLVSLSSSFGFFGRLLPSFLDYYSAKSGYSISRTASMASLMAPMAGAFFLLINQSELSLYASTTIIGTCTGAITSVAVSATSELFGTKNFGVNHNVLVSNIPVGSLCFGYFSAYLYQKGAQGSPKCIGSVCYMGTFGIWGATSAIGTVLCTALYARSRRFAGTLPVRIPCLAHSANLRDNKAPEVSDLRV